MQLLIARKGAVELLEAPDPFPAQNEIVIQTAFSAISPGTELEALTQGSPSLFSLVRKGIRSWEKIKRSIARGGLTQTLQKIESNIGQIVPMGYSISGQVVGMGSEVEDFQIGDWVIAVGPGAYHGTVACVPRLMCAKLPDSQLAAEASTAALACIGIHAVHRAELSAGEEVAVFGLGVIGQLTQQSLRASGHRVIAFDPIPARRLDAAKSGTETYDPTSFDFETGDQLSQSQEGFDAVFVCAKSSSSEVLEQAAKLCRKRGKIIIVGEFPIQISREAVYKKEIEIRVSAAYGEGRYDPLYETLSQDYPLSSSRWTVQRNLQLFVRWLKEKKIQPAELSHHRVPFEQSPAFYKELPASDHTLHIIEYKEQVEAKRSLIFSPRSTSGGKAIGIALIGPGQFALNTHVKNIQKAPDKFELRWMMGRRPGQVAELAAKLKTNGTCELNEVLQDDSTKALLIATPHKQHSEQTLHALRKNKHVFVEKPLSITEQELESIDRFYNEVKNNRTSPPPLLFVGFNRRFAPVSTKLAEERSKSREPVDIRYEFLAAPIEQNNWLTDPSQGGRFIGEGCHAVDWILWFVGAPVKTVEVIPNLLKGADIFLSFQDGSRAHLDFKQIKNRPPFKERITIQTSAGTQTITDFLELAVMVSNREKRVEHFQSKGHAEILDAFAAALTSPPAEKDAFRFLESTRFTLQIASRFKSV